MNLLWKMFCIKKRGGKINSKKYFYKLLHFMINCVIIPKHKNANALLAQLDRVFGYEPKGQGFESLAARQREQLSLLR